MSVDPFASPTRAPVQQGDVLAGKYVVERVLGVGGMGVVVAARHQLLGGKVALKFVLPELSVSPQVVQRFVKEAQSATTITSEHVARVTDVGTLEGGVPYMVMEYLEGSDLASVLQVRGPLPVWEAIDYLLQALQAVTEAHVKGIVHRDLKPSNLFLTRRADGTPLVKVLDFGIAKAVRPDAVSSGSDLTGTQGTLGSPLYMSPEQIRSSKHVDARSNVWSAGVILYELLTGAHPFMADSAGALLAAILTDAPSALRARRTDVPEPVERAIFACLEKDVARRIPSAHAFAELVAPFGSADSALSLARIAGISGGENRTSQVPSFERSAPKVVGNPTRTASPMPTASAWGKTEQKPGASEKRPISRTLLVAFGVIGSLAIGGALLFRNTAPLADRTLPSSTLAAEGSSPPLSTAPPEPAPPPPAPPIVAAPPTAPPVLEAAPSTPAPPNTEPVETRPRAPTPVRRVTTTPKPRLTAPAPAPQPPPAPAATEKPATEKPASEKPAARKRGALDGLIDQR